MNIVFFAILKASFIQKEASNSNLTNLFYQNDSPLAESGTFSNLEVIDLKGPFP